MNTEQFAEDWIANGLTYSREYMAWIIGVDGATKFAEAVRRATLEEAAKMVFPAISQLVIVRCRDASSAELLAMAERRLRDFCHEALLVLTKEGHAEGPSASFMPDRVLGTGGE